MPIAAPTRSTIARQPLVLTMLLAVVAAFLAPAPAAAQTEAADGFVPVTDAMLQDPAPGDWLTWRRTLDGWGYSPLDQIDRDNVDDLRMVWTRALAPGRQEGTPLAYEGVLYMPQASDVIEAIDAVTGDLLWAHWRDLPEDVYDGARGLKHPRVVDDAIDDRGGGRRVEEDLGPTGERQVRRHHQAAALVALADEAEQQVGTGLVEWNVAQFVADDDVKAGELVELASQPALLLRFDEQRDQLGRGHEPHPVVVLAAGHPQGDGQVRLAGADGADDILLHIRVN